MRYCYIDKKYYFSSRSQQIVFMLRLQKRSFAMSLPVAIVLGIMFVPIYAFFGRLYSDGKITEELNVTISNQ